MPGTPMGKGSLLLLHDDPLGNRMVSLLQPGEQERILAVEASQEGRAHFEWLASSAATFHRIPLEGGHEHTGWQPQHAVLRREQFEQQARAELKAAGLDPDHDVHAAELAFRLANRLAIL